MGKTNSEVQLLITAKDEASSTLKKVGTSMEGVAKVGKVIAAGLAVAGGAAVAFGISAVKSFNDSQKTIAQLDAVLKSTNQAAGVTRDKALQLAAALQKQTTYSDEAVLSAENMLLTFTNIKDDVFPDATKTVLDMSTALGQDTKNSAIQLGKALQDPITGITALRRVGVNFTDDQKAQIETLVKSGKTMEAQKLILRELNTEFGGSAAAQADTFAGKIEQMKNNFDDLKESIGKVIVDALVPLLEKLNSGISNVPVIIQNMKDKWAAFNSETTLSGQIIQTYIIPLFKTVGETLGASWERIKKNLEPIMPILVTFGKVMGGTILAAVIALAWAIGGLAIVIAKAFETGTYYAGKFFKFVTSGFSGMGESIMNVANAIKTNFFAALKYVADKIDKIIAKYNDLPFTPNIPEIRLGRQFGGGVNKGEAYMVGEKRPEVFVPSQTGNIKQVTQVQGGGNSEVTININGDVTNDNLSRIIQSVKESIARDQKMAAVGVRTL